MENNLQGRSFGLALGDCNPRVRRKVSNHRFMTEAPNSISSPLPDDLDRMCNLVLSMARALVDNPEAAEVEPETLGSETVLRLYVAEDDLGKLIGKQGRTARCLRTILTAAGGKTRHRYSLDVQAS